MSALEQEPVPGARRLAATSLGPALMLTSWTSLLSVVELEATDDVVTRSDLLQLRALCGAADSKAFTVLARRMEVAQSWQLGCGHRIRID